MSIKVEFCIYVIGPEMIVIDYKGPLGEDLEDSLVDVIFDNLE